MQRKVPREPTSEECSSNAFTEDGIAIWYPQMGGYVSKCIILYPDKDDDAPCTDVYVWHDGAFPFSDQGQSEAERCWCWCEDCPCCEDSADQKRKRNPVRLHHCLIGQFEIFGKRAEELLDIWEEDVKDS